MAHYDGLHLEPDEHVIMEVRKHWIVFAGHAVALLLAAFLPFIILVGFRVMILNTNTALSQYISTISVSGNTSAVFLFFYVLWLLFLWISFFISWTTYYLDVWYVTEKRIIAVDQKRIFDREISNLRFDKIQDVTIDVSGFISTMLNFGDVKVQTASENEEEFTMSTVRHPDEVRRVIFNQHNEIGDTGLRQGKQQSV